MYEIGPNPYGPIFVNQLSGISNITEIRIHDVWNIQAYTLASYPIYYDDFSFTPNLNVNITSGRVSGILNGTTQNALLGADVALQANVVPSNLTGGTYFWSVTGPNQQVSATNTSSSYTVRWTESGTYQATVTYNWNGFSASSTVNVNVIVPTFDNFTATQDVTLATKFPCVSAFSPNSLYTLGCLSLSPGITFSSTIYIPPGQYLSDLNQSGIKYVQRVSAFRKQLNGGVVKCRTRRASESDNNSGWLLDSSDGTDTYDPRSTAVRRFSEGLSLTITTADSPAEVLEGQYVEGLTGIFAPPPGLNDNHQHDALKVDDYFEMYVVYFTTTSPSIQRTVGKLPWNWGGIVVYDARRSPTTYRELTTFSQPSNKTGFSSNQTVTYQGYRDSSFVMGACPGSPPPAPSNVDNARFFIRQQYYDILQRQPDGAWLVWVSFITECGFDQTCTNRVRIGNVRGFFESPEFRASHPGFNNPGSYEYNSNYVQQLYWTLLKRPPDGAWLAWLDYINQTGNYDGLVGGFINSNEYRNRLNSL